ncbi:MAG TPA: lactate utilization protein C [Actinospica sp.]|nr:lactate utilization protein C [Actinospica sp.]
MTTNPENPTAGATNPADAASATTAREEILARIRRALADVPKDEPTHAPHSPLREQDSRTGTGVPEDHRPTDLPRAYLQQHGSRTEAELVDLLAENLADYRAHVHHASESELPDAVARLLTEHGSTSLAIPNGLPDTWLTALPTAVTRVPDSPDLSPRRLDEVHSVISGCALAIAETGTIVLDGGPGQGRRMLTLVPDHHICVVRVPDQVVASVPQAFARGTLDPARPQTWIAGPSATSDIELDRVEGVHGPRRLDVILLATT